MTSTSSLPQLPTLYFEEHNVQRLNENNDCSSSVPPQLPSEILSLCVNFCHWGDLAKLACVQSTWSNIMMDAASHSVAAQWELAQALLEGTCGLQKNPERALAILKELAHVETNEDDQPIMNTTTTTTSETDNDNIDDNNNEDNNTTTECFAPAISKIAECYFQGNGVKQQSLTGMMWLQAAFELANDITAAHDTALIYEYGRNGIEVDVVAAAQWFERAAEAGHVESMAELGLCYELGCGVEQSDEMALDWYTKAANLGHVTAKFSVGEAFESARGVPQSDEEACLWYYRAALTGDEDSKVALRRLYDIARIVVPGVAEILNE